MIEVSKCKWCGETYENGQHPMNENGMRSIAHCELTELRKLRDRLVEGEDKYGHAYLVEYSLGDIIARAKELAK